MSENQRTGLLRLDPGLCGHCCHHTAKPRTPPLPLAAENLLSTTPLPQTLSVALPTPASQSPPSTRSQNYFHMKKIRRNLMHSDLAGYLFQVRAISCENISVLQNYTKPTLPKTTENCTSAGQGSCSLTDVPTKAETAPFLKCPPQNIPPASLLLEGWTQHTTVSPAEAQQSLSRHLIPKRHGELSHNRKIKGSSIIFPTQQTEVYIHFCFLALMNSSLLHI